MNPFALRLLAITAVALPAWAEPVISEFMADNASTLADEDGEFSDWIEIHNPTPAPLSLAGWKLTDDARNPGKWSFPDISLEAGGFQIFFASGKNLRFAHHTNFKLAKAGEYLALVRPDGSLRQQFAPAYPAQAADESYGSRFDPSTLIGPGAIGRYNPDLAPAFYGNGLATPGWINGPASCLGKVEEPRFSVKHGVFSAPFQLALSTTTPGASIRYTTDGSTPTATTGSGYVSPLAITATTNLRAAAFLPDWQPTGIATQTYLFPNDIIRQQPNGSPPPGWPTTSGSSQVLDFGMDPAIVDHSDPELGGAATVSAALRALPSVVLTGDLPDFFNIGGSQGFYANPYGRGTAWERPVSCEWINPPDAVHPNGSSGFQVNCGVRLRGGHSREPSNPKHAFRLFFRGTYGPTKLQYPLFGRHGAREFDGIDLRTSQNYSWSFQGDPRNTFLREEACRQAQLDMGQPGSRVRYVHLYLNGVYWGLYNLDERTEAAYSASYFGGGKEDYDVVKTVQDAGYITAATDGSLAAWRALWTQARAHAAEPSNANYFKLMGKAGDGVTPTADPVLLDPDNLIDYLLLTFDSGNLDGCMSSFHGNDRANNWFGTRRAVNNPGEGFRFFVHDFEHVFFSRWEDRTGPWEPSNQADFTYSNPYYLHRDLIANPEYRLRWADRIQRHLFDNGALTPSAWNNRINRLATAIDRGIVAESARWGDAKNPTPFTKSHWSAARNSLLEYITIRHPFVLEHLRADDLYPTIDAPVITPFGGHHASGVQVTISGPDGATLYHMADGSDPRAIGGAIRPDARVLNSDTTQGGTPLVLSGSGDHPLRVRAYHHASAIWSALSDAVFSLGSDAASPHNLAFSEIMYHPADPTAAEIAGGFSDPEDFEFLEIINTGTITADLRGLFIFDAVRFDFGQTPAASTLAPGERLLIVANSAAFAFRYGVGHRIAGSYSGNLANSGETITLQAADDSIIRQVTYSDTGAWPAEADGLGHSLVAITPGDFSTDNDPAHWRPSTTTGGNPGGSDAVLFPAWLASHHQTDPAADPDGDGLCNLMEYILGGSPATDDRALAPQLAFQQGFVAGQPATWLVITHRQRTGADSVVLTLESALDPAAEWTPADALPSRTLGADGTATLIHRVLTADSRSKFWRLKARLR